MKNLKPTEQVAYQEGYYDAKDKEISLRDLQNAFHNGFLSGQKTYKNDFIYGFYTGLAGAIITVFICLIFNLEM